MNCQKCGTTLPVETRFCPQCGTPVALSPSQRVSIPADVAKRAQRFAGRLWVLDEVINWLDHGSGRFLLIMGEPGCGKTTLAAWLAGAGPAPDDPGTSSNLERVRDAWNAAHFCMAEDKRGTLNPARFAQSLARQLSNRYDEYAKAVLQRIAPEVNIYQKAHENWGYMVGAQIDTFIVNTSAEDAYNYVVREPLEALLNYQPNLHIFILVDALDEALTFGYPSIVTLLAGSGDLPAGVRFLLTSRNEPKVLDQFRQVRRLDLSSKRRASQADADIHIYVEQRMSEETIEPHVAAAGSPETIRERLVKQAAGNFLYIQFLLDEVAAGKRSLTDLTGLPSGLFGLYHAYLDRLMPEMLQVGASQRWAELFQPLLGCLSVAVSVAPQQVLPGWLGRPEGEVEALLNDLIQLVEYDQGGYRLYHRSMAEFLAVKEYQENGMPKRNRYYTPLREQHERIALYYLDNFEGNWQECDVYGLRYLSIHLAEAEQEERLCTLLTISPEWMEAKFRAFTNHQSLVMELEMAIAFFTDPLTPSQLLRLIQLHTVRQLVQQRVSVHSNTDLKTLVWLGREVEASGYARLREDLAERFNGLLAIYDALVEKGQPNPNMLNEALRIAHAMRVGFPKIKSMCATAVALALANRAAEANKAFKEVWEVARTLQGNENKSQYFQERGRMLVKRELADALARAGRVNEALELVRDIQSETGSDFERIKVLGKVAVALKQAGNEVEASRLLKGIQADVDVIEPNRIRAYGYSYVAEALTQVGQKKEASALIDKALVATRTVQTDADYRAQPSLLARVAAGLAQVGRFDKAREIAYAIYQERDQAEALKEVSIALSRYGRFDDALAIAHTVPEESAMASALSNVAAMLAKVGQDDKASKALRQALDVRTSVQIGQRIDEALGNMAAALAQAGHFEEAETMARAIRKDWQQDGALSNIVTSLALRQRFDEALELAQTIQEDKSLAFALINVSIALSLSGHSNRAKSPVEQAMEIAHKLQDGWSRSEVLRGVATARAWMGCFEQALKITHTIEVDWSRADALRNVAMAMVHLSQKDEAAKIFDETLTAIKDIEIEGIQVAKLCEIAMVLAWAGYNEKASEVLDEAKQAARTIREDNVDDVRVNVLSYVATSLHRSGRIKEANSLFDDALAVTERLWPSQRRWRTPILSKSLTQVGRFKQALDVLGLRSIEEFLESLAQWAFSFEEMESRLSVTVLKEATRIAGWTRTDWLNIHELLCTGE